MAVHGRPYWGAKIELGAPFPFQVMEYELDGEPDPVDWTWIYNDLVPGYVPPQLTFCGEAVNIGPLPGHAPIAPIRVYYSRTGNGVDWQLVDPADYMAGVACANIPSVLWPGFIIALDIFDFTQADTYLAGVIYIMWTEHDPVFNASKGLSPKVIGVTPV